MLTRQPSSPADSTRETEVIVLDLSLNAAEWASPLQKPPSCSELSPDTSQGTSHVYFSLCFRTMLRASATQSFLAMQFCV